MSARKKHILFVDDEQYVLDGLRRMLRSMQSEWEMRFARSGHEALVLLAGTPCDVIVSDMRMPGMPGEALLAEVRNRYPAMIRLALSGQSDKEIILKSVGPIHQFLQKPCDEQTLKSTISRTIELCDLLADDRLKSIVTGLESLPSLPSHQQELTAQFQRSDVSTRLIGDSISKDMAMTAKILQLVNSAFFGLRRRVNSPADAVKLLGLDTVRSLVMTIQVFSQISETEVEGFSQKSLLSHSAAVAAVAKKIVQAEGKPAEMAERACLAGLLHDVGKLALASKMPAEYAASIRVAGTDRITAEEAERRVIGASHAEIGAFLLGLWAFDPSIVDAALFHHRPAMHAGDGFTILTAVHAANAIVRFSPTVDVAGVPGMDMGYLERLGLSDHLGSWLGVCKNAA